MKLKVEKLQAVDSSEHLRSPVEVDRRVEGE